MTPKEKAEELVRKFLSSEDSDGDRDVRDVHAAIRCAIITVDEIIRSREDDGAFDDTLSSTSSEYYTPHPMYLTYWLQIKQELKKL
jgi:hypothetical protein